MENDKNTLLNTFSFSYDAKKQSVFVKLSSALCKREPAALEDILIRADAVLANEKARKNILSYQIFDVSFRKAWDRVTKSSLANVFLVEIANATPEVAGVEVTLCNEPRNLAELKINSLTAIQTSDRLAFRRFVVLKMKDLGVTVLPNTGQIDLVWYLCQDEERFSNNSFTVGSFPVSTYGKIDGPWKVLLHPERDEVWVMVRDCSKLQDANTRKELQNTFETQIRKLERLAYDATLHIFRTEFFEAVELQNSFLKADPAATEPFLFVIAAAIPAKRDEKEYAKQQIANGFTSINIHSEKDRYISSLTLCLAQEAIADIQKKFFLITNPIFEETFDDEDVKMFQLNFQLFPFTRNVSMEPLAPRDRAPSWLNSVLREMISIEGFQNDPAWISNRLYSPIKQSIVAKSLESLQKAGLILYDPATKKYTPAAQSVTTGDDVGGESVINFYKQMQELTLEACDVIPPAKTSFVHRRFLLSEDRRLLLLEELQELCLYALELEKVMKHEHVFQLNLQLFPI